MGKLLSIDAGRPEIYYGVFFRDCNGRLQVATDNFYAERKRAEMLIELWRACKAEGTKTDYFIATLSMPGSAEEAGKCSTQDLSAAGNR